MEKGKDKLDIHWKDPIEETLKKIDEYFSKEENRQDFLKYCEEESKKDVWTHLQCNEMDCVFNRPSNPTMGTITWCDLFKNGQEDLCNEKCGKRTYYEPMFRYEEEE